MGSGPSITWNTETDSLCGTGKSVVTDPIEIDNFNVEKFWLAFERYIRTREKMSWEKAYETSTLKDGGVLSVTSYDIPFSGELKTHAVSHFNLAKDEVVFTYYHTDSSLTRVANTSTFKLYRDPLRMEYWTEEIGTRHAGPFIKSVMAEIVKKMGGKAEITHDVESLSEKGQKSVVTGPIEGGACAAETFVEWSRATTEASGATLQPDGLWLEETQSWFSPTVYRKYSYDAANDLITVLEYGTDSTCSPGSHISTTYTKVHKDPFRLELWNVTVHARSSGYGVKLFIEKVINEVLKEYSKDE